MVNIILISHGVFCEGLLSSLKMIAGDDYSPEALKEMASYVKKNGLKIYGFTTIADKDTLLKLSKQSEVYEIYTEELN